MSNQNEVEIRDHDSFYGKERAEETGRKGKKERLPKKFFSVGLTRDGSLNFAIV
jgi:hypothetical protein